MATSSFDKTFVISNVEESNKFLETISDPRTITIKHKNLKEESAKGLELLSKRFKIKYQSS